MMTLDTIFILYIFIYFVSAINEDDGPQVSELLRHRRTSMMKMLRQRESGVRTHRFSLVDIKRMYGVANTMEQLSKWNILDVNWYDELIKEQYEIGSSLEEHAARGNLNIIRFFVETHQVCGPTRNLSSVREIIIDHDENEDDMPAPCLKVFMCSVAENQPIIVKYWLQKLAHRESYLADYVAEAAKYGHMKVLKILYEFGIPLGYPREMASGFFDIPLNEAVKSRQYQAIRFIIESDRSKNERTLLLAAQTKSTEIFDLVESLDFSTQERLDARLLLAIAQNTSHQVGQMLRRGANPNLKTSSSPRTMMDFALDTHNFEIISTLFKHGAQFIYSGDFTDENPIGSYPQRFNHDFFTSSNGHKFIRLMFSELSQEILPELFTRLAFTFGSSEMHIEHKPLFSVDFLGKMTQIVARNKFADYVLAIRQHDLDTQRRHVVKFGDDLEEFFDFRVGSEFIMNVLLEYGFRDAVQIAVQFGKPDMKDHLLYAASSGINVQDLNEISNKNTIE